MSTMTKVKQAVSKAENVYWSTTMHPIRAIEKSAGRSQHFQIGSTEGKEQPQQ